MTTQKTLTWLSPLRKPQISQEIFDMGKCYQERQYPNTLANHCWMPIWEATGISYKRNIHKNTLYLICYIINYNQIVFTHKHFISFPLKMVGDTKFSSSDLKSTHSMHLFFLKARKSCFVVQRYQSQLLAYWITDVSNHSLCLIFLNNLTNNAKL
jgi:hypothetical protein